MTTPERDKALDKIRKLLALSSSPNEHEAKLAAERASMIMQEHQIQFADVEIADLKRSDIAEVIYTVADQKRKLIWISVLARGCAKLFDGEVVRLNDQPGTKFKFVGYPSDIEAMKSLFEHLYQSWISIAASDLIQAKKTSPYNFTPKDTMGFKQGHGVAYARAIYHRCIDMAAARKQAVSKSSSTCTALVVLKDIALKDYAGKQNWVRGKSQQSSGDDSGQAYGTAAGNAIALGGALEKSGGALN